MLKKAHILFLFLSMLVFYPAIAQEKTDEVCRGTKSKYKANPDDKEGGSTFQYQLPAGTQMVTQYSDSIIVQWGNTNGTFSLGVQETSKHGCVGDWAYLDVTVIGKDIHFVKNTYSMCEGDSVYLGFNTEDFQNFVWSDKSAIRNNYAVKEGEYTLTAIDVLGCRISSSVIVKASPKPHVYLGKDTMICTPGFTLEALRTSGNPSGTVYSWSTGQIGPSTLIDVSEHDPKTDMIYWVRADDPDGCSASDTIVVLACKENPVIEELKIPNTFTPNGDGDNDVWNISALRQYPDCMVEVFDRWGRKVFTSNKGYTSNPWDGRDAKGHYLPMETYYYIIHLNDGQNNKPILGTITIIR